MLEINSYIRKVSVGPDYKAAMVYMVGQSVMGGDFKIHAINRDIDGNVSIFVEKNNVVELWKLVTANMPMVFEMNVDF